MPLKWNSIVGKTIKAVKEESINCVQIDFTDGTDVMVDTEARGHGIYGPILFATAEYKPQIQELVKQWKYELGLRDAGAAAAKTWETIKKLTTHEYQVYLLEHKGG
jgi:hypothetical protein